MITVKIVPSSLFQNEFITESLKGVKNFMDATRKRQITFFFRKLEAKKKRAQNENETFEMSWTYEVECFREFDIQRESQK